MKELDLKVDQALAQKAGLKNLEALKHVMNKKKSVQQQNY
jgi:hypothetical protein